MPQKVRFPRSSIFTETTPVLSRPPAKSTIAGTALIFPAEIFISTISNLQKAWATSHAPIVGIADAVVYVRSKNSHHKFTPGE